MAAPPLGSVQEESSLALVAFLLFSLQTASQSAVLQDACSLVYHHLGIQITAARDPMRFQCQFFQERLPPPPSPSSPNVSEADGRPRLFPLDLSTRLVDLSTASIKRPIRLELSTQIEGDKQGVAALFQAFTKARNPLASLVFPRSPLAVDLWIYVGKKRIGIRDLSSHGETKAKAVVTLLIENPVSCEIAHLFLYLSIRVYRYADGLYRQ